MALRFRSSVVALLPPHIKSALERLAADWAAKKLDGKVTVREFLAFIASGLDEAMTIVVPLPDGKTKKTVVLEFAGYLYDVFEPFILVKFGWLAWLFMLIGGSNGMKDEFLQLVDLAIELFYNANIKPAASV